MEDRFELGRVGIWTGVLDAVPSAQAKNIAAGLEGHNSIVRDSSQRL